MPSFSSITIIYNPNSTGNGKQVAIGLRSTLHAKNKDLPISLKPTKHAGHAETMAYDLAKASKRPLVISASGDGGYHEVINGLMRAQREGANPVAGLLPAGNANDHYTNLHATDTIKAILQHKTQTIDLLKLTARSDGQPLERFGHSYIGIGLTPKIGKELNETDLNWFNEIMIVLRVLFFLKPVRISIKGKTHSYDSLIFSNIDRMAKVLTLSKTASIQDGKFELTAFRARHKFKLISTLIHSSTLGVRDSVSLKKYRFKTVKPTLVQIDGEIRRIDATTEVAITIEPAVMKCIV